MKHSIWEITKNVTVWEFNRFFKWMDLVKGFAFFAFFGLIGGVVGSWAGSQAAETPVVAVSAYGPFNQEGFEITAIRFEDRSALPADSLNSLLMGGEIDGILTVISDREATIRTNSDRAWIMQLQTHLNELRSGYKLEQLGLDAAIYTDLTAEVDLSREFDSGEVASLADKFLAGGAIALLLMAVFMGFAYQFTAITAEKQQRITEQVLSAISPQTWIDGKILGITGVGLAYVAFYGAIGVFGIIALAWFGAPVHQTLALINPLFLVTFVLMALIGTLMWNAFLAGVAATIDDPNTSTKSGFMFLPMFPVMLAFLALVNPDTVAMQLLSIFPLTSYAVLPARMVLTSVSWWEPVLAIALLAVTAWLLRVAAGRIFAAGMMMYGKEPDYRQMLHWMLKGSNQTQTD
ncbi:MAG: ABC-2 type transport system permease component [Bacteroidetes bacterium HLUCCA01]|nr:MAG: ABC-2 type transport system permease component [Bacteroidetes bacterium HLUCCA01]